MWMVDALRSAGLRVVEEPGWRQRGHGDFLDLRGVLCHHTAGGGPNDYIVVRDGRQGLPGPLAQLVLERDGTYRAIAVGVCWHAGRGSWPGWPTDNANFHVIGIEAVNTGTGSQPWPTVQLDAYKRGAAALLEGMRRGSGDCVAHREYSSEGKIDPWGIDMNAFRRDVQKIIDGASQEAADMTPEQAKQLAAVHKELTQKYPSRSKYRKDDKPVDTLAGLVINADARVHEASIDVPKKMAEMDAKVAEMDAKLDRILAALEAGKE